MRDLFDRPLFHEPGPRVFGLSPGADLLAELASGLRQRLGGAPPEAWGRVTLWLPTRRMRRRFLDLLSDAGPGVGAAILPRVRLVSEVGLDPAGAGLPPPVPSLRRRLELAQLIAAVLDREPDLAPRARLFDLSDSLAALMEEMQGEGVSPAVIAGLDVSDQSGHWARSLRFLQVLSPWFEEAGAPDGEARARRVAERLGRLWLADPPPDPVIVAGSTGARGATARLMEAVARLPQGAVVLPGFDANLPRPVWDRLTDAMTAEDHPQSRIACFLRDLPLDPAEVRPWSPWDLSTRARLVSLALRPPPVTDQWLAEGPTLEDLAPACEGMTLMEAPSPRVEAEAIALRLRHAVEERITAALVTPDRTLARRVAAALDRWGIVPDDSGGEPLSLSPPGRLLRQVAALRSRTPTPEAVLALLKHPLARAGDRGAHMAQAHAWELHLRRRGPAALAPGAIRRWGEGREGEPPDPARHAWALWVADLMARLAPHPDRLHRRQPLGQHLEEHVRAAEALCAPGGGATPPPNPLWAEAAGRAAREAVERLARHAEAGGAVTPRDFAHLLDGVLGAEEVRRPDRGHPQVLVWGTQEAWGQGADLVILAGLNEGAWPAPAPGDPWLNRRLREAAGLPLPERRIGAAAHDFAQAVGAAQVWLTRAVRTDEAPTTPSRWLNRLLNLIGGLPGQGGPAALRGMEERARPWIAGALRLAEADGEVPRAPRPSPRPPAEARLRRLSVTAVERLLRDPYSVYAAEILRLRALDPLTPQPDALERGTHLHKVMEAWVEEDLKALEAGFDPRLAQTLLMARAEAVLAEECGWPVHRRLWAAQLGRAAPSLMAGEAERRARGRPALVEVRGQVDAAGVVITGTADRIDRDGEGRVRIYDYKTGKPPSRDEQLAFAKQLLIEAAMAERGAFGALGPVTVAGAAYVGLGAEARVVEAPLGEVSTRQVWEELVLLLARYAEPTRGFTARIAPRLMRHEGEHDHLARWGEWDHSTDPTPLALGWEPEGDEP